MLVCWLCFEGPAKGFRMDMRNFGDCSEGKDDLCVPAVLVCGHLPLQLLNDLASADSDCGLNFSVIFVKLCRFWWFML